MKLIQREADQLKLPLTTLLHPPQVAIVRARIPGFATLALADQRRAAAFALRRDFGVDSGSLVLTAMALPRASASSATDDVAIAFTNASAGASAGASAIPAAYLQAIEPTRIAWFNAPTGFAIGPDQTPPREIMSMLSANPGVTEVVVLGEHRFPAETLQWWQAATGVTFVERDHSAEKGAALALEAVDSAPLAPRRTALDRALWVASIASVACCAVALLALLSQRGSVPAATTAAAPNAANANAGAMFVRITTIAPELRTTLKTASFGGNAWVISLSNAEAVPRYAAALRSNGFAVQTVTEPDARLRVSLP